LIERLRDNGVTDFRLNLHYLPDTIERAFESGTEEDWQVSFRFEPEILGTAGGLKASEAFFNDEALLLVSGDIVMDFSLDDALKFHKNSGALATLVLRPQMPPYHFTPLHMDEAGRLSNFKGSDPDSDTRNTTYLFASVHILSPRIFDYIPNGRFSEIFLDAYPAAIAKGETVLGFPINEGYWNALDNASRYLDAHRYLFSKEYPDRLVFKSPEVQIHPRTRLGPFASLEPGCVVESGAEAENSILWRNSTLKSGVSAKNCILGSDMAIDADCMNKVVTKNGEASFDPT
jgi:NDP-sugar pyrophosphorylase family protein